MNDREPNRIDTRDRMELTIRGSMVAKAALSFVDSYHVSHARICLQELVTHTNELAAFVASLRLKGEGDD